MLKIKRKCAVFTMVKNESFFLPISMNYYEKHFEKRDIYVLDHQSNDGSTDEMKNCIVVENDLTQDHNWMTSIVVGFLESLLKNYDCVLFAHVDEIVSPDPRKFSLRDYISNMSSDYVVCTGLEVLHMVKDEGSLDMDNSILSQRRYWYKNPSIYNKPLLTRVPLRWTPGCHNVSGIKKQKDADPDLFLIHLHRMDFEHCKRRHHKTANCSFYKPDLEDKKWGWHAFVHEDEEFAKWFYCVDAARKLNSLKSLEIFNAMKVNSFDKLYKEAERKCELVPPYLRGVV